MNGVLLIDKPSGPTSHDAVARLRKTSGERRIGHTGTLDPLASGLLVLVLGQATRLATFLSGHDKSYEAIIQLGTTTDTDDARGVVTDTWSGALPGVEAIDTAIGGFAGTYLQMPPQHSAKRVDGVKAYELARRDKPVDLKAVEVSVKALERTSLDGNRVGLRLTATSGFYVRSLARNLGEQLGCGAHLAALRRTSVGPFLVQDAQPLQDAERAGSGIEAHVIPAAQALPDWPSATVNEAGMTRALHGNPLSPLHLTSPWGRWPATSDDGGTRPIRVRILDAAGGLVALAEARGAALHPVVVLM
jgi:tRNA pseudouridine55 synthase